MAGAGGHRPHAPGRESSPMLDGGELYERWFDSIYRWLRAFGVGESDLEDAVHEVFVVVERQRADFPGATPAGWLYSIARRKAASWRRRAWLRGVLVAGAEVERDAVPQMQRSP